MPPSSTIQPSRRLLLLIRPHLGRMVLASICLGLSTVGGLAVPYAVRLLIDSVFVHHNGEDLNRIALAMIAIVLVTAVFTYFRGYLTAYVGGRIVADLRVRLYERLLHLSLEYYDEHRVGDLLSRLSSDTTLVQSVLTDDLLSLLRQIATVCA